MVAFQGWAALARNSQHASNKPNAQGIRAPTFQGKCMNAESGSSVRPGGAFIVCHSRAAPAPLGHRSGVARSTCRSELDRHDDKSEAATSRRKASPPQMSYLVFPSPADLSTIGPYRGHGFERLSLCRQSPTLAARHFCPAQCRVKHVADFGRNWPKLLRICRNRPRCRQSSRKSTISPRIGQNRPGWGEVAPGGASVAQIGRPRVGV